MPHLHDAHGVFIEDIRDSHQPSIGCVCHSGESDKDGHIHQCPEGNIHFRCHGTDGNQHAIEEKGDNVAGKHPSAEEEQVKVKFFGHWYIAGPYSSHCLAP